MIHLDDTVIAVLLADGWHEVADESFEFNSSDFLDGIRGLAATWMESDGTWISCPLASVIAVREKKQT